MAKKLCNSTKFGKSNFDKCKSLHERLDEIKKSAENVKNEYQREKVSKELQLLVEISAKIFKSDSIQETLDIMEQLIDFKEDSTATDESKNTNVAGNILKAVNDIIEANIHNNKEIGVKDTASRMRNMLVKLAEQISKSSTETIVLQEQTVAMIISKHTAEDETLIQVSSNNGYFNDSMIKQNDFSANEQDTLFSVRVPVSEEKRKVTAVLYENPIFYPDNATVLDFSTAFADYFSNPNGKALMKIVSVIAEIRYAEIEEVKSFGDGKNIQMNFSVKEEQPRVHYKMALKSSYHCAYYNTGENLWVTGAASGCNTSVEIYRFGRRVNCQCSHMTSFAVLMSFTSDYDPLESTVTSTLLGVSVTCLFFTILAYLPAKDLRRRRTVRTNLLLSTSLLLSSSVFFSMEHVVDTDQRENRVPSDTDTASTACLAIAFLMNYLWLCQMAWMVCEAAMMYMDLVLVFNTHTKRFLLKSNLACWGLPLLFPTIGMVWGKSDFAHPKTCFLRKNYGLLTFYGPVLLCILFNALIFAGISISLFWKNEGKNDAAGGRCSQGKKQLKFAVTLTTVLGLAWMLGFFLIVDGVNTIWVRWLFIILNSTQGVAIFILYVVLNEDLKKIWKKMLTRSIGSSTSSSTGRIPAIATNKIVGAGKKSNTSAVSPMKPGKKPGKAKKNTKESGGTGKDTLPMTGPSVSLVVEKPRADKINAPSSSFSPLSTSTAPLGRRIDEQDSDEITIVNNL